MNCEKCKTDLFDKEASTDNWSVFKAECPKCGTRVTAAQMKKQMDEQSGKKKRKKA